MNRASVFEWHKRFKEGTESVRDDKRCGRSKEVRTPELIGQIKNFMDKDRRVPIETSLMSVWELHTQLFARNWRCGRFAQSLSQGCSEKIRKKDVVMKAGRSSSWSIQILQFLMLWWPAMKAGSTAMTQRPRDSIPSGSMLALPDPRRPDRANQPTNFWWSPFLTALAWSTCTGFPLDSQQGILYAEVLREFRKRFCQKRPALFKSGQWHFYQDNAPVNNSILVTDYLTKMGIKTVPHPPYSADLAPCDFCFFPKLKEKLRGCRYETIEEMKEAVMKVIDTLTWGLPWGLPEVVETVKQVHCSRRRLLRRGLEFHVCTINKSAHMKKVWKLIACVCVCVFVFFKRKFYYLVCWNYSLLTSIFQNEKGKC